MMQLSRRQAADANITLASAAISDKMWPADLLSRMLWASPSTRDITIPQLPSLSRVGSTPDTRLADIHKPMGDIRKPQAQEDTRKTPGAAPPLPEPVAGKPERPAQEPAQ